MAPTRAPIQTCHSVTLKFVTTRPRQRERRARTQSIPLHLLFCMETIAKSCFKRSNNRMETLQLFLKSGYLRDDKISRINGKVRCNAAVQLIENKDSPMCRERKATSELPNTFGEAFPVSNYLVTDVTYRRSDFAR